MRADRFGSYSIEKTFAGIPCLSRLKSIMRYFCFAPPPRWRAVMWPWWLRPAFWGAASTSERSGLERVISSNVDTDMLRRPGDVGRYTRTGMCAPPPGLRLQLWYRLAVGQCHDGLLPRPRLAAEDPL